MIPAFLITLREMIEASLIVATILGILYKLNQQKSVKTVWFAAACAGILSIVLIILGSLFGFKMQKLYSGRTEEFIEGVLMITSAIFITWAVFFLHNHFAVHKIMLIKKIKDRVETTEQRGLFILVFSAVFREGLEIVLFLSTIYFSTDPRSILIGFIGGVIGGLLIAFALFSATLKMPVYQAFRITSILLIMFAAGLLARGIGEFSELEMIPSTFTLNIILLPLSGTYGGDIIRSLFGISKNMDLLQVGTYAVYTLFMSWHVFWRKNKV